MKVADMWDKIQKAGLPKKSNADINASLAKMAAGKFSFMDQVSMKVVGTNAAEMQQVAQGAQSIIANDFKGNAQAALGFFGAVQRTAIGQLDFMELVKDGTADKLAKLSQSNPGAFASVIAGKYPDAGSLARALGTPTSEAPAEGPAMAQVARPAAPRPV